MNVENYNSLGLSSLLKLKFNFWDSTFSFQALTNNFTRSWKNFSLFLREHPSAYKFADNEKLHVNKF